MRRRLTGLLALLLLFLVGGWLAWLVGGAHTSPAPTPTVAPVPVRPKSVSQPRSETVRLIRNARAEMPDPVSPAVLEAQRQRVHAAKARLDAAYAGTEDAEYQLDRYRELDERRWISRYDLEDAEAAAAAVREEAVAARIALDSEEAALSALLRDGAAAKADIAAARSAQAKAAR